MDETELKIEPDFENEEKQLLKLLLIYAIAVTLCRVIVPGARYLSLLDWMIFRKAVLAGTAFARVRDFPFQSLPYYIMPFIGPVWLAQKKRSRAGLLFVVGMSLAGIVNHAGAWLVFLHNMASVLGRFMLPGLWGSLVLVLAAVFAFLSRRIYLLGKLFYDESKKSEIKTIKGACITWATGALLAFCFISPLVDYQEAGKQALGLAKRYGYENVRLLKSGTVIS